VPDTGLLCDLLWSDPDKDMVGWGENDRGVSFTFGEDIVAQFLRKMDLDLVCRAHQVVEDGYEFFARRQLVTIFSAPNYCGEFDNAGGMMAVDETRGAASGPRRAPGGFVASFRAAGDPGDAPSRKLAQRKTPQADVLVPDPQAGREGQAPGDRGRGAAAGDAPGEEALRGIHFAAMTRLDAAGHPARLYI